MYSLIQDAKAGNPAALEKVTAGNTGLVRSIARRFEGRGCDFEDLCQIGMMGLIKAVRRFDTSYNVCFSTYAVPVITGEIKRFLRDDGLIKVSRSYKELALRAKLESERLAGELGREPTIGEIAVSLDTDVYTLTEAMEAQNPWESVYKTVTGSDNRETYLIDKLAPEESLSVTDKISISCAVSSLDYRQRQVIAYRYFMDETQTRVAARLGISQVQVSRIEKKALGLLKEKLKECS